MILSNVNIGTGPSAGDGDPLRTAFNTINNNFQNIQGNVNSLINNVTRVAGRTGNVTLTTLDIVGINNYATVSYVNSQLGNAGSYSNVNVTAFLPSYSGSIATVTAANLAMKGYVDASIASLVDSAPGTLDTLNELAAALGDDPNLSVTLTNTINSANTNMKAYVDGQITAANTLAYSNVNTLAYLTTNSYSTQAYVNLANTTMKSYVDGQVAAANSQAYSNVNVSTYLPGYTGNIGVNTITFGDLSQQATAYTGTQWRSNLESNVRVKPSWVSYVPGLKTQEGTQYGFDTGGMFFTGNADNDFAYPIQTNLHLHESDVLELIATIYYSATNNDHGVCIFPVGERPIWRGSTDSSRIAFQFNTGIPVLYGQTTANTAPGTPVLSAGNYYTIKFKYDPGNTVTVETFSGNTATGSAIDIRTINEILPAGDYQVGFDADNDSAGVKSYFTNVILRTLSDTVVNDLEVQGQITGNLIPSASVIYDLGNVTHRWKDLWLSGSTIHIGNANISVSNGSIQSSAPIQADITGNVTASNITISSNSISIGGATLDVSTGTLESSIPIATTNLTINGPRIDFAQGAYVEESVIAGNPSHYGLALNSPTDGIVGLNALGSNADVTSSVIVSNVLVQLNVANITPGGNALVWLFDQSGNITFPDSTVQTTAYTGSGYSNVQVATYLPTYTGNIAAGNVRVSSGYRFETGNVRITNDNSSVTLTPDTSANALAGVAIGGNGYLLAPNNARNITLNYNSVSGAVGLQANVTVGSGGSGNLFVQGNIIARDITGGNIIATGTSGVIGFNSGGFVQQATSNASGVVSHTTSGNIQLMSIDLGAHAVHTVAFTCNKLTTNDMLLVNHVSGGVTSVYVDAYVASDGLAIIWLRDLTGNGTGAITPMLKYAIIRAPSA